MAINVELYNGQCIWDLNLQQIYPQHLSFSHSVITQMNFQIPLEV